MSWMDRLYQTYENCASLVGVEEADRKLPLLPIAHMIEDAQIEVSIDSKGNFLGADMVLEKDCITITPCTEESASPSGQVAPHPLCDKLEYVAGDYKKFDGKKSAELHRAYINALADWCASPCSHPKVNAIFAYLKKGTLIEDLVNYGLLRYDEAENTLTDFKDGKDQIDAFIRFKVMILGDDTPKVWLDKEVWQSYIDYTLSNHDDKELCYVTGRLMRCANKHPFRIRYRSDLTKLISSNDSQGYTYRGRFSSEKQVVRVGYETSQKAHNVLKWLIERQGYKNGDQVILAWGTRNEKLPNAFENTYDSLFTYEDNPTTAEDFAKRLNTAIMGYKCDLEVKSQIVVMALDSTTKGKGRLSITYYNELSGPDFLRRVEDWYKTCAWQHTYKYIPDGVDERGKQKFKNISFFGAPSPNDIVFAAYGKNTNDKLKKSVVERLLHCIIDSTGLPVDIMKSAFMRAVNPVAMEGFEWEKTLSIACALYRKFKTEEDYKMALDPERNTRDYLYGRLLAIADRLERATFERGENNRETNAMRYMNACAQHPYRTWKQIHERLNPYLAKLGGLRNIYEAKLAEVTNLFLDEDFIDDRPLEGEYILGFWCQRKFIDDEIAQRKADKQKTETENNN